MHAVRSYLGPFAGSFAAAPGRRSTCRSRKVCSSSRTFSLGDSSVWSFSNRSFPVIVVASNRDLEAHAVVFQSPFAVPVGAPEDRGFRFQVDGLDSASDLLSALILP